MTTRNCRRRPAVPQMVVSETDLQGILSDRDAIKVLKKQVSDMEKSLEHREADVMEKLKSGVPVEGGLVASIEKKLGQCRPAWKDAFRALAKKFGLDADSEEKRVQDETEVPTKEVLTIVKPC